MIRRGPHTTLAFVAILAAIFLWANTLVPKSGNTGAAKRPAPPLDLTDDGFVVGGADFKAAPVAGNDTVVSP